MRPLLFAFFMMFGCGVWNLAQQPSGSAPDQTELVAANNAFTTDLYGRLRSQPGNLFFSPESISTAFAMAYAGARGQTATGMAHVFHYTLSQERLHPAMGKLLAAMNAAHPGYELHVADALWAQQDANFLPDYLQCIQSAYGAGFNRVDFKSSPESVRGTINQWVEKETKDRIKDLLPPGAVTPVTRLVLTNAIYFKGSWVDPFQKAYTRNEEFHVPGSQSVQAPFMRRIGAYRYHDGVTFQVLELPYKGDELSMVIVLPKKTDGLPALEKSFTAAAVSGWMQKLQYAGRVHLRLPRFTMTQQLELSKTLAAMGMPQAFNANADFSGMTGKPGFMISAAIHKAFVDVNETGTEAAAATAPVMSATAMRVEPPPIEFVVDHPFLFFIRDTKSGSLLFLGRVIDPTK